MQSRTGSMLCIWHLTPKLLLLSGHEAMQGGGRLAISLEADVRMAYLPCAGADPQGVGSIILLHILQLCLQLLLPTQLWQGMCCWQHAVQQPGRELL